MLTQQTHKRLYHWHSVGAYWISVLLIMLSVTAVPVVFKDELQRYVFSTALSQPVEKHFSQDELAALTVSQLGIADGEFFVDPATENSATRIWWFDEKTYKYFGYIQNNNGDLEPIPQIEAVTVIALAHYEFLIPDPYGEYLVGFIGLFTMILGVVGVLLHVKWRKEKKQFRKGRSFRVWSSDLHKLLGFWLLPYYLLVSYTGTILGLGGLLLIMSAISSFEGDQEAAVAAVLGEEPAYSATPCDMLPIDELLEKSKRHWQQRYGENELLSYDIHYYHDCHAELGINTRLPGYLLLANRLSYSLVDGALIKEIDWLSASVGDRWYALLGPLHYGHFAGYLGRWLYAISAIALVVLIISGLLLWVDKQQTTPMANKWDYFYVHPLLRICTAVIIAITATSYIMLLWAKVYPGLLSNYSPYILYLASFFILSMWVYFLPKYLKYYCICLAILSLLLIGADFFAAGFLFSGVNLSLMIFTVLFILVALKINQFDCQ